jgi:hypothetical protein
MFALFRLRTLLAGIDVSGSRQRTGVWNTALLRRD